MKTLKNHTLLYDSDCPACSLYTKSFVQSGKLDTNGRCAYSESSPELLLCIDAERAKNEIALVDKQTKQVRYGIDSLIHVISHDKKTLNTLLRFAPVYLFLKTLYLFVSYNRKVIMPSGNLYQATTCNPSFHFYYRLAYLIFTAVLTGVILNLFIHPVLAYYGLGTSSAQEFLVVCGQILFQGIIIYYINKQKCYDYLGNMMTVSLFGAGLLLPFVVLHNYLGVFNVYVWLGTFGLTVNAMLYWHYKRCKLLRLPLTMTIGWVTYRVIVLTLILFVL